jgi:Fe2+ transport system protein FeoA
VLVANKKHLYLKEKEVRVMVVKALTDLKPGQRGIISKVGGSGQIRRRILDMGVVPQTEVGVERVAPLGDPIEVRIKGYHLSLRKEEAANIYVEVA